MKTWFTSDHHFGHFNIIKYCDRPFNSVGHMNSVMEATWNGVVEPDDLVYYLGDFAMQPRMVTEILPRLNGAKILIAGNHDRCYPKNSNAAKWLDQYLAAGFASVHTHMELKIENEAVLLQHFPYRNEADPSQKYFNQRPIDKGGWLIHGHVHNRWKVVGKQINVSVEVWNFEPVGLETIAAIIAKGPAPRDSESATKSYD